MKINLEIEEEESVKFFNYLIQKEKLRLYLRKQSDWVYKLKPILVEYDKDTGAVVIELQFDGL